jgi:hypothetical protein
MLALRETKLSKVINTLDSFYILLYFVIILSNWRFFCNRYIMRVTFVDTTCCNTNKTSVSCKVGMSLEPQYPFLHEDLQWTEAYFRLILLCKVRDLQFLRNQFLYIVFNILK